MLKHLVLVRTLLAMQRKPLAICYLDTHAGAGAYDLSSVTANKVGEYQAGIARVLGRTDVPALALPWLEIVGASNPAGGLRFYPGSPALARHLRRPQDRMVLIEKHPSDWALLRKFLRKEPRCRIERIDGFAALKSHLPPLERRGVVLIDPSYELKGDYRQSALALEESCRRWPGGVYLLWYPMLAGNEHRRLAERLSSSGVRRILNLSLELGQPGSAGLRGSGLLLINPPWQLDEEMAVIMPWLANALAFPGQTPQWRVEWLVPE